MQAMRLASLAKDRYGLGSFGFYGRIPTITVSSAFRTSRTLHASEVLAIHGQYAHQML